MLEVNMIMALPKGQAFAMLEGGSLWKIRMPLPDDSADERMPKELMAIANDMRQRYRTSDHWWQTSDESAGTQYFQFIAKNLARMGDHATSIAEQVVYLVTGEHPDDPRPKADINFGTDKG